VSTYKYSLNISFLFLQDSVSLKNFKTKSLEENQVPDNGFALDSLATERKEKLFFPRALPKRSISNPAMMSQIF
jgi:hypothetical protein